VKAIAVLTLATGIGFGANALANEGALDLGFGVGGVARVGITDADDGPSGCRPFVQPDRKILICGTRLRDGATGSDFLVARFDVNGTLDPTFGNGGTVTIDFDGGGGGDQAEGIALQADGRIIVAGTTHGAGLQSDDFAVARLDADGALDQSFANGGKATIAFDLADGVGNDDVHALAIEPSGTIVLAGSAETTDGSVVAIARLLGTGARDASFNFTGKVTFGFALTQTGTETDNAQGMAIDDKGRIVIAGTARASEPQDHAVFGVARLSSDGTLDTSFNGAGAATIAFDPGTGVSDAIAMGVAIQEDGDIVVSGYANTSPWATQNIDMAAARLHSDGMLDATFGSGGLLTIPFDLTVDGFDAAIDAIEQPDGYLFFVGTALGDSTQYAIAARVHHDGSPDLSFGVTGKNTYDLGFTTPGTQVFTGVALQGAQIVAGGIAFVPPLGSPQPLDCLVVRVASDSIYANGFE